jgi:hypothetical protein
MVFSMTPGDRIREAIMTNVKPARVGLSASRISALENLAQLGLARWSFDPEKWAWPEL